MDPAATLTLLLCKCQPFIYSPFLRLEFVLLKGHYRFQFPFENQREKLIKTISSIQDKKLYKIENQVQHQ